ncbi:hypothetical protein IJH72_03060 [Candidatus Saccharibacteria bacterium]|nr:hypothetical protein [Candidatus Saccharibacteria bacterium]
MSKFLTLLKASIFEGMSLFKFKTKGYDKTKKMALFVFLAIVVFVSVYGYADMMLEPLSGTGMEYSVLTMYSLVAVVIILAEGVYKASGLLFNCRDDDLVLALPIKKSSVFLLRMMKFYLFELAFSTMILLPTMVAYVVRVGVLTISSTFYLASFVALILLPVIPVVLAVLISMGISGISTRFRFKNLIQIVLTMVVLVGVMILSFNIQDIMTTIAEHVSSINEMIMRLYYPVGAYIQMVTDFRVLTLIVFILVNLAVAGVSVLIFSKVYFKINSRAKTVRLGKNQKEGKIKTHGVMRALMIKEGRKFISSPVFLVNAGFSLLLYLIAVIMMVVNFDWIISMFSSAGLGLSKEEILNFMPVIVAGLIVFCALMTSITSSMISLEGGTINILKSMPVSAFKIIMAKVLTAVLIAVPVFLIGDVVLFIKFDFSVLQMLIILALSIIVPIVAEVLGIIVNLKYPKMDARNDTEIVKQSMSSMVAVFMGMILSAVTVYLMYLGIDNGVSAGKVMIVVLGVYTLIMMGLIIYLKIRGDKELSEITV